MILSGWGRNPRVHAEVEYPKDRRDALPKTPFHPRGLGRSYGDASLPALGAKALDTRNLNRILAFNRETGVVEAEAGVSMRDLLRVFVPQGWFPPVTPGTQWVTLGGALASNIHGKNHHRSGSIEHFVEWLEVATPTGIFTCSLAENADLFRATVGGYGLTGVITRLGLRLRRINSPYIRSRALRCSGLKALFEAFKRHDADCEYSVAWVDTLASGEGLGRGVLFLGDHGEQGTGKASAEPHHQLFRVPFAMPGAFLNRAALALFNTIHYRLPRPGGARLRPYEGFFYPLDRIGDWNLLYGPKGFFQYQCMLPDPEGEKAVEEALRFLARHGLGSFLAVLKRCGDDTVMLPFCKRGYTLALDVPNRGQETLRRMSELDALVAEYGGRVYLTKDARLSPETFRTLYPEWRSWMDVVKRYNPEGLCRSLLSERLRLWDA